MPHYPIDFDTTSSHAAIDKIIDETSAVVPEETPVTEYPEEVRPIYGEVLPADEPLEVQTVFTGLYITIFVGPEEIANLQLGGSVQYGQDVYTYWKSQSIGYRLSQNLIVSNITELPDVCGVTQLIVTFEKVSSKTFKLSLKQMEEFFEALALCDIDGPFHCHIVNQIHPDCLQDFRNRALCITEEKIVRQFGPTLATLEANAEAEYADTLFVRLKGTAFYNQKEIQEAIHNFSLKEACKKYEE